MVQPSPAFHSRVGSDSELVSRHDLRALSVRLLIQMDLVVVEFVVEDLFVFIWWRVGTITNVLESNC